MPYLVRLKQAADLHSCRISQWLVLEQLERERFTRRMSRVVETYRRKRDDFAAALHRHFAGLATWRVPPGGLFFWLRLEERIDTRRLLPRSIEQGVAFMPGEFFFPERPEASGTIRLNFSHATETEVDQGLSILAELVARAS
jgi:DNA-binding transcriptional MocR family regulator